MFRLKLHLHGAEIQELVLESGREYTFGRGSSCDVQLVEDKAGISRVHFRLAEENGQWTAHVVSKFGELKAGGQSVRQLTLDVGGVFKLGPYDFVFLEVQKKEMVATSSSLPMAVGQSGPATSLSPPPIEEMDPNFEGNDEATKVVAHEPEIPFIRIVGSRSREREVKLEGRRWIAGRDDTSNILLNDRKSSRRQFEMSSTPQGYFIRDLGSSNGTLLNGMPLAPDELKAIRSGDVIQVGSTILHFEVRDPHFQTKLMVVPSQVRNDLGLVVHSSYEMINYPVPHGPGGAVRLDGAGWLTKIDGIPIPFTSHLEEGRRRKVRFWAVALTVVFLGFGFLSMLPSGGPGKPAIKVNADFEKLSPKQQEQVKQLYHLARNLYMQQKLALAGDQLEKLHLIIPSGYENSLAMANECAQQKQLEQELRRMEDEKRRMEEIRRTVESTVRTCEPVAKRTLSLDEISQCLRPALDFDPENGQVRDLISMVKSRIDQANINAKNRADYSKRVARGRMLYETAFQLYSNQEYQEALDAYRKHAESHFDDPENLKGQSRKQIISIMKKLSGKVDDSLRAAEAAYAVGNFREALDNLAIAKKMDPSSKRTLELIGKYRNELKTKLREIYEEAVIYEGLGQIEEAKTRWKKILEVDTTDGDYYMKARNKLRIYGAFGN